MSQSYARTLTPLFLFSDIHNASHKVPVACNRNFTPLASRERQTHTHAPNKRPSYPRPASSYSTALSFPPSSILPTRHHSSSSRSSDPACIALSSRNHIRYSQHHLDIHRTHGPVLTIAVEQTKIVITSHSLSSIKQSPALPSLRPFKSVFDNQSWPCNSTCLSFSAIGPAC